MASPTHLRAMQALEAAVRTGSLKDAADELGITPAAVGQRIKGLEDYLGITLLERGRAGLAPAPELQTALPHLGRAFAELSAAARELDLQRVHEIHIAAASDFVELWLAPRLPAFRAAYPGTLFCINGAGEVPMRLGRVDCAIGFGAPPDPGGDPLADVLFSDFLVPVGSPANVARVAARPEADRLEGFPLLHLDFFKDDPAGLSWPDWFARNGIARTAPERGMRFQRITAALDAVEADAGMCLAGLALLLDHVETGAIELPYAAASGTWTSHAFTARYRGDSLARRHIARFRGWLNNEAQRTRARLVEAAGRPEQAEPAPSLG